MQNEYYLRPLTNFSDKFYISEDRFNYLCKIKEANRILHEIEDAFGVFFESVVEFEKELLLSALDYRLKSLDDRDKYFRSTSSKINLRFLNFLTCARTFEEKSIKKSHRLNELSIAPAPVEIRLWTH